MAKRKINEYPFYLGKVKDITWDDIDGCKEQGAYYINTGPYNTLFSGVNNGNLRVYKTRNGSPCQILLVSTDLYFRPQIPGAPSWSRWIKLNQSTTTSSIQDMTENNVLEQTMGGGIKDFAVGPYAVTVRQKGGLRNGKEEYITAPAGLASRHGFRQCKGLLRSDDERGFERKYNQKPACNKWTNVQRDTDIIRDERRKFTGRNSDLYLQQYGIYPVLPILEWSNELDVLATALTEIAHREEVVA